MDISSDELARLYTKRREYGDERETREIEVFFIVAQINTIRTNYTQAKIDNIQQNRKRRNG